MDLNECAFRRGGAKRQTSICFSLATWALKFVLSAESTSAHLEHLIIPTTGFAPCGMTLWIWINIGAGGMARCGGARGATLGPTRDHQKSASHLLDHHCSLACKLCATGSGAWDLNEHASRRHGTTMRSSLFNLRSSSAPKVRDFREPPSENLEHLFRQTTSFAPWGLTPWTWTSVGTGGMTRRGRGRDVSCRPLRPRSFAISGSPRRNTSNSLVLNKQALRHGV